MTPKVSCLNFGVQSLFDSKSSNAKKLTKISWGESVDKPPLYGGEFGGQKHQKYHQARIQELVKGGALLKIFFEGC